MTFAKVLFPEPFGPMTAWTSPLLNSRVSPRRISLSAMETCNSWMTMELMNDVWNFEF